MPAAKSASFTRAAPPPCSTCPAMCCRYFVLELTRPRTRRDFEDLGWMVAHQNTYVYVEDGQWHLLVYSTCKHLQADNRCGIYETRPRVCREYAAGNQQCEKEEMDGGNHTFFERFFTNADELAAYYAGAKREQRRRTARSRSGAARLKKPRSLRGRLRRGKQGVLMKAAGRIKGLAADK